MTDTLAEPAAVARLVVLSGLHAGAQCGVFGSGCSIGSGAADAVVLGDAGVAPAHVTLEWQGGSAAVRTLHGDVALNGAELPPGDPCIAALPFELALADVVVRCEAERPDDNADANDNADADDEPASTSRRAGLLPLLTKSGWRLPALACAGVALLIIAPAMGSITPDTHKAVQPAEDLAPKAIAASLTVPKLPAASATGSATLTSALHELQAELSARSLSEIQLVANDGMIMARGRADPRSESEWRLVQQWFDGRHARKATLVDEVRFTAVPAPKLGVDAVWAGPNPNVVIKGQKYFEGATLPNGFRLERITPGEVLVAREGQRQALKF